MDVIIMRRFSFTRSTLAWEKVGGTCTICGKPTTGIGTNNETGESVIIHRSCVENSPPAGVPFPVRVTTDKNLKNHLGMGNQWIENRPTSKFFEGISGSPTEKTRINFNGHVLYATVERAQRDGLLKEAP